MPGPSRIKIIGESVGLIAVVIVSGLGVSMLLGGSIDWGPLPFILPIGAAAIWGRAQWRRRLSRLG